MLSLHNGPTWPHAPGSGSVPSYVSDLMHKAMACWAPYLSMGSSMDQMTWHWGLDAACRLGMKHPCSEASTTATVGDRMLGSMETNYLTQFDTALTDHFLPTVVSKPLVMFDGNTGLLLNSTS